MNRRSIRSTKAREYLEAISDEDLDKMSDQICGDRAHFDRLQVLLIHLTREERQLVLTILLRRLNALVVLLQTHLSHEVCAHRMRQSRIAGNQRTLRKALDRAWSLATDS